MKDSIRNAYGRIHTQEEWKEKRKIAVAKTLSESSGTGRAECSCGAPVKRIFGRRRGLVVAAACLLFVLTGCGAWTGYHTPTALISVDINPSLELGINYFDRVVSVTGYNEDGEDLAEVLDVKYCDYEEAMCRLLDNEKVTRLLAEDGILTIAVSGRHEGQCQRVQKDMDLCVRDQDNAYCYRAEAEEAVQAHHLGMTCGRYRVYQMLSELCPELTPEEVREMTMGQLYEQIEQKLEALKGEYGDLQETMEDLREQFGGHYGSGAGAGYHNGSENGNGHHGGRRN